MARSFRSDTGRFLGSGAAGRQWGPGRVFKNSRRRSIRPPAKHPCRACEGLLVFIGLTNTDARFLGKAKQRKSEEDCGYHKKQGSAKGVL